MKRKHKILMTMTAILFLLLSAIPADTKGMEETAVWDITWKGTGEEPFFRSSVVMEVDLKGSCTKDDIMIFVNRQKWEGEWDYEQTLKMTFYEEGNYEIHLIHRNGYEETRKITIELSNPTIPKVDSGSYTAGKWTNQDILLEAHGSKAVSKISHYEYKTGNNEWRSMKYGRLELKRDMDDLVLIRAVSNAGRYSEIQKIWCRLWKKKPQLFKITCSERSLNGWYGKIPEFTYESEQAEGPLVHVYAQLTQLQTGQIQTETDQIPQIKKDGKYQLKIWTKDEAGNASISEEKVFKIDMKKPEIYISGIKNNKSYKTFVNVKLHVKDENLDEKQTRIYLNGKRWIPDKIKDDGYYVLRVEALDLAGNQNVVTKKFTINKKGVHIYFLQKILAGKNISEKSFRPGFQVVSLEPVQVTEFLMNGQKVSYEWEKDKVYIKQPITENGNYRISLNAVDANGERVSSKKITFFYDTKKPVIQMSGLNEKSECDYGTIVAVSLENKKDYWTKVKLDEKEIKNLTNKISFKKLEPGIHVLKLQAKDAAGNVTNKRIKFAVTKILPHPVKQMVEKDQKKETKVKDKREKSMLGLWIAAGMAGVISAAWLFYRKYSK